MNEELLIKQITDVFKTEKYCTADARSFLQLWFNNNPKLLIDQFTEQLNKFADKNNWNYLIIMHPNKQSFDAIRFWELPKVELIEDTTVSGTIEETVMT